MHSTVLAFSSRDSTSRVVGLDAEGVGIAEQTVQQGDALIYRVPQLLRGNAMASTFDLDEHLARRPVSAMDDGQARHNPHGPQPQPQPGGIHPLRPPQQRRSHFLGSTRS